MGEGREMEVKENLRVEFRKELKRIRKEWKEGKEEMIMVERSQ